MRIEAGKFYKTRDGRKVGPMNRWSECVEHPWEAEDKYLLWRDDGSSDYTNDLISEWTEEPIVPTKTLRDEFAMATLGFLIVESGKDASVANVGFDDTLAMIAKVAYKAADAMLKAREG